MKITTETLDAFIDSKSWWAEGTGRKMDDLEVVAIQKEILRFPKCQFLQIGTNFGWTAFSSLKNLNKVGGFLDTVDLWKAPKPKLQKRHSLWVNHFGDIVKKYGLEWIVAYYTNGSNHFFKKQCEDKKFNVIFIDGDHRYSQSKRDLDYSVEHLHEGGTIFFHDVRFSKYLGKSKSCGKVFMDFKNPKFRKHVMETKFRLGVIRSIAQIRVGFV